MIRVVQILVVVAMLATECLAAPAAVEESYAQRLDRIEAGYQKYLVLVNVLQRQDAGVITVTERGNRYLERAKALKMLAAVHHALKTRLDEANRDLAGIRARHMARPGARDTSVEQVALLGSLQVPNQERLLLTLAVIREIAVNADLRNQLRANTAVLSWRYGHLRSRLAASRRALADEVERLRAEVRADIAFKTS